MTFEEAEDLALKNENLIGKYYKQIFISAFIILPTPLNEVLLTVAAHQLKESNEYWPDKKHLHYELYILFDLNSWVNPQQTPHYSILSNFLSRLDYKYIH